MARFKYAASTVALLVALSTSADGQAQSVQTDYTYDVHGRLTKVARPGSTTDYTYDKAQNRTNVKTTMANNPPVAYADTLTVTAGSASSINPLSNDTDADADTLTLTNASGWNTSKGSVAFVANCLKTATSCVTYTANSGASGTDSFTYTVSDGKGSTATGTVSVTINATASPPAPAASTTTVTANYAGSNTAYPLSLNIGGGTPTSLNIISQPTVGGTASVSGTSILFTPTNAYSGQTSLQYTASNANGASAVTTATIKVLPVVSAVSGTATMGSATTLPLNPRTNYDLMTRVGTPLYGAANISGGNIVYTPTSGAGQTETLAYTATTAGGVSAPASITFSIAGGPPNNPPTATSYSTITYRNSPTTVDPRTHASDPDGDPLTIIAAGPASNGAVTFTSSTVTYSPSSQFSGEDSFSYTVSDGRGGQVSSTVNVTVIDNRNPIAVDDNLTVPLNTYTTFDPRTNDSDPDGDSFVLVNVTNPAHGQVWRTSSSIDYMPNSGYYGPDSFTYTIGDGRGSNSSSTATVHVTVLPPPPPPNNPPIVPNRVFNIIKNTPIVFDISPSDPDGDTLTLSSLSTPAHGVATKTGNMNITYTPSTDYTGSDIFTYLISDGKGGQTVGTVYVNVYAGANNAPTPVNDQITVARNSQTLVPVLANDTDPDGDAIFLAGVYADFNEDGNLAEYSVSGNKVLISSRSTEGTEIVTYIVSDNRGGSNYAYLRVTVEN